LYDMHGNVWEWCLDAYSASAYASGSAFDPVVTNGALRVLRGGAWLSGYTASYCRSAFRSGDLPSSNNFLGAYGFRIVLAPVLVVNSALNMVRIAPGVFQMGSMTGNTNEQPVHQVALTRPFWMGKFEVTQAEYQALMGSNPSYFQGANAPSAPQRPVEMVSWNDALAYCQALTAAETAAARIPIGYQYRLPTEAEWEYCCRGGTTTEWHTGTSLSTSQANFGGALASGMHPSGQTAVVGSYGPNAYGLHDMHGNVREFCLDSIAAYAPTPVADPFVTGGTDRVYRGGGCYAGNPASTCRSAYRVSLPPSVSDSTVGFRVVLAPVLVP
jgi:formylglycine-generating enzyme required for sulfatase activity